MHDLEVVEVAVRLVEVAVGVEVVAVPLVEGGQPRPDLLGGQAAGALLGDPGVDRVGDQRPGVGAHHVRADGGVVAVGLRVVAGAAVACLVVTDLDPVGDGARDAVAARGLPLVVGLHRLGRLTTGARLGGVAEVELPVVGAVVVRLPHGAVVDLAVGAGDLVALRAGEGGGAGDVRLEVLVGELRVALVAELDEHHEHPVGGLPGELDVLRLAVGRGSRALSDACTAVSGDGTGVGGAPHSDDRAAVAVTDPGRPVQHRGDGLLAQRAALGLQRVRQLVSALERPRGTTRAALPVDGGVGRRRCRCCHCSRDALRCGQGSGRDRRQQAGSGGGSDDGQAGDAQATDLPETGCAHRVLRDGPAGPPRAQAARAWGAHHSTDAVGPEMSWRKRLSVQ